MCGPDSAVRRPADKADRNAPFARFVPAQLFPFPPANVHLSDFRRRNFAKPSGYSRLSNSAMFPSFNESNEVGILHRFDRNVPPANKREKHSKYNPVTNAVVRP